MGGLDGTTWWEDDADASFYAASLMKVPVATAAQRRHERGELDLDAQVPVHDTFDSAVPGARYELDRDDDQDDATWDARGGTETLRELRRRSIVVSGNLAVNLVLEHVGIDEVTAVLADAGCSDALVVARGIDDVPAKEAGIQNVVNARDLGRLLAATPTEVEAVMRGQAHRDAIPAGLPEGTAIANKTGWIDGCTHDMAIVRPLGAEPFALAVLVEHTFSYTEANALISLVASRAWERRR